MAGQKPTILKSLDHEGSEIRMFGSINAAEANEIIQFVSNISIDSFSSLKEQDLQVTNDEISTYKKIYAIAKDNRSFKVTVGESNTGNTLIIQRVQCGLKQCDLGVSNVVWEIF
jgi:hypothetical protein